MRERWASPPGGLESNPTGRFGISSAGTTEIGAAVRPGNRTGCEPVHVPSAIFLSKYVRYVLRVPRIGVVRTDPPTPGVSARAGATHRKAAGRRLRLVHERPRSAARGAHARTRAVVVSIVLDGASP